MRSKWTLTVEGLGRIERAAIEVRPLTLFVGENNSGKSYLASLLWDFQARMPDVFSFHGSELRELEASSAYQACSQWLTDTLARSEPRILGEEDIRLLLRWFNERLDEKKDAVVQRVFGRAGMTLGGMSIQGLSLDAPFELRSRRAQKGLAGDTTFTASGYGSGQPRTLEIEHAPDTDGSRSSHRTILITLLAQLLWPHRGVGRLPDEYVANDPVYLPASRTGFILLYKDVIANLISRGMAGATGPTASPSSNAQLTIPARHFLQLLALGLKPESKGPHAAEADLLERHAFPGTVGLSGGVGVNEVEYRYDPARPPLPMQLSSSLVTELSPLILVLRHLPEIPMLFLEEPEAHLHPRLVRLVARIIARLVRKGVQVCVTTHSADFCQQINNLIKLGSLAPDERARLQAEYDYDTEDYLDASEVAGYQFLIGEDGRSAASRLEETPSGLAMPTFNEELFSLSKQTLDLQRAVEGQT
jgi:AAA domain, putative AbiEii toxin, Type IV TA system